MSAEDTTLRAQQKEVSDLNLRMKELCAENLDLRDICAEDGVQYEERIAARRHKRYFAQLSTQHPIGRRATASDILGSAPTIRAIAEGTGSVLRTGLIARCFFTAFVHLTEQFPWKFGVCMISTFEVHMQDIF